MVERETEHATPMQGSKIRILPLRTSLSPVLHDTSSTSDEASSITGAKPAKKSRTSRPKVRSGCLTCKTRRVKCDETKPDCNRCSTTGRKCDGYLILPRKKRGPNVKQTNWLMSKSDALPLRMLGLVTVNENESSALEFFHAQSANSLSRFFDAPFWTNLVLQMSVSEASVRHAMMAVGSLHRQRETGLYKKSMPKPLVSVGPLTVSAPLSGVTTDHNDPFALVHYNRAISHLSKRLQDPETSIEVTLFTCILFVCIEYLRGDIKPALQHFNAGLNIAFNTVKKTNSASALAQAQRIRSNLLPFFSRLELLSLMFGNDTEQIPSFTALTGLLSSSSSGFTTIQEARDSLVHLMNHSFRFVQHVKRKKQRGQPISPDEIAQQLLLCQKLQDWTLSLDHLGGLGAIPAEIRDGSKVLRIHEIVTHLWLSTCVRDHEMQHDKYFSCFETAITLCEEIQKIASNRMERARLSTTFLFDMEVVSPLYYIATKCRHPRVRRKAIALVRRTARKEGLWNSEVAASIAERIMQLEEMHLDVLDGSQLPLEHHRIHKTLVFSADEAQPGVHDVTFYYSPQEPQTVWRVSKETIVLPQTPNTPLSLKSQESVVKVT